MARFFSLACLKFSLISSTSTDRDLGFPVDIPGAVTRPEVRDHYIVSSLIQESITSSQLEGAATPRAEAKEMLRTGRPPRDKSERMILNNYLTMRRIRELQDNRH